MEVNRDLSFIAWMKDKTYEEDIDLSYICAGKVSFLSKIIRLL
jgi:hypothetical protein